MSADIIHHGHLRVIEEGVRHIHENGEFDELIIGLLTDEAVASYKRIPLLKYAEREAIISAIKGVDKVVPQKSVDYTENLLMYKPNYVIHGDDWKNGSLSTIRTKVIDLLSQWGGHLIEIPYTKDISSTLLERESRDLRANPHNRCSMLRRLLSLKPCISVCEASNGLSGLIVENAIYNGPDTDSFREFDCMWLSSLCDSTFKGKPDIELVDFSSRIQTINEIMEVTSKPMIVDGDTGGRPEHFAYNIKTLERLGVSAIIVEDKCGPKRNSLFGTEVEQTLEDPYAFASKLVEGKRSQITKDFMIFARIEALIAGKGIDDALNRAKIYLNEGMCDGVCIHSKEKDGKEIKEFLIEFRKDFPDVPVILIPTTYNQYTEEELTEWGANIIIHANHLLRSAYPAMMNTAKSILEHHRSKEASESYCMSIKDVLSIIPGEK